MRRTTTVLVLVALGLGGAALGGCGDDGSGSGGPSGSTGSSLTALRGDPMATALPAGTAVVYEGTRDGGTTLGKPVQAKITRRLSLDGTTGEAALAAAADAAARAGWRTETSRPTTFSARKRLDGVQAGLRVSLGDFEGSQQLFVYLTAD